PERKTVGMIVRSGEFALNVLEMEYLDAVYLCGRISGKRVKNKFKKAGLTPINARKIGAPAIKEASAVLECEVWKTVEAGDHVLFLGEVIEAYASEKFDEIWRVDEFKPIFHVGGRKFAGVGGEILAKEGK
ncbi:flavin reductase family protein, partial [Candidatus Geothermarchaeota archaeon]